MTQILKQSTAVDVLIGPFVDSTDGYTGEVGVSPAVKLSKNGQALAAKNDITTPVSDADGYYNCELDATDTNTVGTLVLSVVGSATSLPVRHEYQVVEEAVYDALYAASAAGPLQSTVAGRTLDVSAGGEAGIDWANVGSPTTAVDLSGTDIQLCDTTTTNTDMVAAAPTAATIADAVLDEPLSGHTTDGTLGLAIAPLDAGTATGGAVAQITLDAGMVYTADSEPQECYIDLVSGTGAGQSRAITGFTFATRVCTVTPNWNTPPVSGTKYVIRGFRDVKVKSVGNGVITAASFNTDAVDANALAADAATEIATAVAANADIAAILEDTGTTLPAQLDSISGATFSSATDSLEAIRDRGDAAWTTGAGGTPPQLLQSTTIATLASQTSFTLTAGSTDNDAYNGAVVVVTDQSTSTQKAVGSVLDYTGATKTVTLASDPGVFTMATGDTIDIIANASTAPTAAAVRAEIDTNSTQLALIVGDTNELQTNQGNWLTATGFSTSAALATAQTDLDTLTGTDGATLATSQANYAPATAASLATAQTDLDTLTGTDGATLATAQGNYAPATAAAMSTAQSDLDTLTGTDGATLATTQANYAPATAAALAALNDISVSDVLTTQMTEAYNADGAAPTLAQALHLVIAYLTERSVTGTTVTAKKLDGSTTAATFTLNDGTTPTSVTRAT